MQQQEENIKTSEKGSVISAMFLVAGTCIGGGMLALPVATGISGFFPSTLIMIVCWLAMTASALILLEINLWLKEGAHIITMSSTMLGPLGKIISWCIFLFISYASIIAYTAAGGSLVINGALSTFQLTVSKEIGCFLFIFVFGGMVYVGSQFVSRINAVLFVAMIAAYCGLITTGVTEIKHERLLHTNWSTSLMAIPLLLTAFSFQTMVPSLTPLLNRDIKSLRIAVIGGTTITLIVYLLWQYLVLGIVPVSGPHSLIKALEAGEPITQFLREHVQSTWTSVLAEFFAFFALVTSFFGMALGLFDFLSDGLRIKKEGMGKAALAILIIIPTYFFSVYYERVFLVALDSTGGYGDTILNGIMPVLMVWVGRYIYKFPNENRVTGGKIFLLVVLGFFCSALLLKVFIDLGFICSIFDACTNF